MTGLFVVHKEKEFNGLNMFDLYCKYTTFFRDGQIFAASEAYNSIKLDKTRYNSMRGASDPLRSETRNPPHDCVRDFL